MTYFVTGATGFIGRHLVQELLDNREGEISLLVRPGLAGARRALIRTGAAPTGSPSSPATSPGPGSASPRTGSSEHRGKVDHFFHLAALYDMTASDELNEQLNVGGTLGPGAGRRLDAGSSTRCPRRGAGDYHGIFDEDDVRRGPVAAVAVPPDQVRVRADRAGGVRRSRGGSTVPRSWSGTPRPARWTRSTAPTTSSRCSSGCATPCRRGCRWWASTSATPTSCPSTTSPRRWTTWRTSPASTARRSTWSTRSRSRPSTWSTRSPAPPRRPGSPCPSTAGHRGAPDRAAPPRPAPGQPGQQRCCARPVQLALRETIGRLGVPPEVLEHVGFPTTFASRAHRAGAGRLRHLLPRPGELRPTLWSYWEEHLDKDTARRQGPPRGPRRQEGRHHRRLLGHRHGRPRSRSLRPAASRSWSRAARTSSRRPGPRSSGRRHGLRLRLRPLRPRGDRRAVRAGPRRARLDRLRGEQRRPLDPPVARAEPRPVPRLRAHHAAELLRRDPAGDGRAPTRCASSGHGHIVNISSIGVQTNPPRFRAYVASKAALDAWSNVVGSELVGDGVAFTTIHMPLVKTPMIAPTKIYDKFPTISPGAGRRHGGRGAGRPPARDQHRPRHARRGRAHPRAEDGVPGAAPGLPGLPRLRGGQARRPPTTAAEPTPQQLLLARMLKGVHW